MVKVVTYGVGGYDAQRQDDNVTASTDDAPTHVLSELRSPRHPSPPAGDLLARASEANARTFRVLNCGTSLALSGAAAGNMLVSNLKHLFGNAREADHHAGLKGGSYENAYNGWVKQPFGGLSFVRARGDSTATGTLDYDGYGDTIIVETSRESDGGTCDIKIDGAVVGTVDCSGTQAYGVRNQFDVTLGEHTVEVVKPPTSYGYVERVRFLDSTRFGVEAIDATYGGSGIGDTVTVRTASGGQVAGVAVSGNSGLDAYFDRDDVDLVVCSWTVNDAGSGTSLTDIATWFEYAAERTRVRDTALLLVVEMGGHYAWEAHDPADHDRFASIRRTILDVADRHPHVAAVDWHAATAFDDVSEYGSRFYSNLTSVDVGAGTYVGDFVHPGENAHQIATSMVAAMVGVPQPPRKNEDGMALLLDWPAPDAPVKSGTIKGTYKPVPTPMTALRPTTGVAYGVPSSYRPTPVGFDDNVVNIVRDLWRTDRDAAATEDDYGPYLTLSNTAKYYLFNVPVDTLHWLLVRAQGLVVVRTNGAALRFTSEDGTANLNTDANDSSQLRYTTGDAPQWFAIPFKQSTGNQPVLLSGKFYEMQVTETPFPIVTATTGTTS